MAGKKYVVGTSDSRKSSLIQKILPTQFSLDEDQEFSNIGPENNSGKNFIQSRLRQRVFFFLQNFTADFENEI